MQRRAEQGKPTPSWDNRPLLFSDLDFAWRTFWLLNSRRPMGEGLTPLPISEVAAAMDAFGLRDAESRLELLEHVLFLDDAYMKRSIEERKKARDAHAASRNRGKKGARGR